MRTKGKSSDLDLLIGSIRDLEFDRKIYCVGISTTCFLEETSSEVTSSYTTSIRSKDSDLLTNVALHSIIAESNKSASAHGSRRSGAAFSQVSKHLYTFGKFAIQILFVASH